MAQKNKTVEEEYRKVDQIEHILIRPDTYVGSIEMSDPTLLWIYDEENKRFEQKQIEYVPGLYKIFDEILVNAADNYQRHKNTTTIKVNIDQNNNRISVWNDGNGIPVQIHQEHKIYVPELIFGHLLAGNNFDDTQKKVVGGRNGYGAKLTNIFSTEFSVETADRHRKKKFKKTWKKNMSESQGCEIKDYNGSDFTCVTFQPDLHRFKMRNLDDSIMALFKKRVYDLAGIYCKKINVYYNDEKIQINSFADYVDLYLPNTTLPKIYDKSMKNDRWEVLVSFSDGKFEQCSFVNSICTSKGGTHVKYITDQLVKEIKEKISKDKKSKNLDIKPSQIQSHLWVFINCLIENPAFDSQTKETLTTKPKDFGSTCELTEKLIKDVIKSGVVEEIVQQAKVREQSKLGKAIKAGKRQRINDIEKLDDANDAGTRLSENCTLILTEGDSAKSLAMAGIEIIGRDKFGVFPLKGKLLNVREATTKQISDNKEIQNIVKILGLNKALKYDTDQDRKTLRYGSIMIMADQDHDGSHIKGLVINFIDTWWPELLKQNRFLKSFATPILKATKGKQIFSFFTISDFKRWAEVTQNSHLFKVKYYKGLGTSTTQEAKEYFSDIQKHKFDFKYENDEDRQFIDLVFNKNKADDRKEWLANYNPDLCINHDNKVIRYKDFINKEFIHFSNSDNIRSIPSLCDGLKPGQRKILFSCFKRNLIKEIKVAQLSGYVSEHSAYHHGEQSLQSTITNMAQNFVGSNNINLLMPNGQFGTRAQGGKDHASARYVFTQLNKVTRYIFPEPDDHLLDYLEDDGQMVEPRWYIPIIPMCLINGAEGIGTGWSTNVPNYNPRILANMIKQRLQVDEAFENIHPWYKGYKGEIIQSGSGYIINGMFEIDEENSDVINITELPVKKWTKDYKNWLQQVMESDQNELNIEDFKEYHANNGVHFSIQCKGGFLDRFRTENEIVKIFKLGTTMQTTNLTLFDRESKLKRYQNVNQILEDFFKIRLEFYDKRKNYLISKLQRDKQILENKVNFILAIIQDKIEIKHQKKQKLAEQLLKQGFVQFKDLIQILSTKIKAFGEQKKKKGEADDAEESSSEAEQENEQDMEDEEEELFSKKLNNTIQVKELVLEYDYLLKMPIFSLTYEKVQSLKEELHKKDEELKKLQCKQIKEMWNDDLNEFLKMLDIVEAKEEKDMKKMPHAKGEKQAKGKPKQVIKKRVLEKENYDTSNIVKKSRQQKQKSKNDDEETKTLSSKNNDDNSIKEEKKKPENVIEPENLTLRERIEQKYKLMKEKPGNETINEQSQDADSLFDFQYKKTNRGFQTRKIKNNIIEDDDDESSYLDNLLEAQQKANNNQKNTSTTTNAFQKSRNVNIFSDEDEEDDSGMQNEEVVVNYKEKMRDNKKQVNYNYNDQIINEDNDDDFIDDEDEEESEESEFTY